MTLGRALVADDPLVAADVIVIAPDAQEAGLLEAADLVQRGISNRVAKGADCAARARQFSDGPGYRRVRCLHAMAAARSGGFGGEAIR